MRRMILAALVMAACGSDGGTGPDDVLPASLVGEWYTGATCYPGCGLTLENAANPADTLNVTVGSTTSLRLTRTGGYHLQISGATDTTVTGTVRAEGSLLILSAPSGADTADYALSADVLQLRWRRTVTVTGPQGPWNAHLRGRFRRR